MMRFVILMVLCLIASACAERFEDRRAAYQARLADCTQQHGFDSDNPGPPGPDNLAEGERDWRECAYLAIEQTLIPGTLEPEMYSEAIEADRRLTEQLAAGEITRDERQRRIKRIREKILDREQELEEERQKELQEEVADLWERDKARRELDEIRREIDTEHRSLLPGL